MTFENCKTSSHDSHKTKHCRYREIKIKLSTVYLYMHRCKEIKHYSQLLVAIICMTGLPEAQDPSICVLRRRGHPVCFELQL